MDVYSRKIVSWELSSCLSGEFVLKALVRGIKHRDVCGDLIIHSDRGVQYTALSFRHQVKRLGFIQSMSRKGNCWDNAYSESCFSLLKRELGYKRYVCMEEARGDVFEWIEGWYNPRRLHSALGYRSPVHFEKMVVERERNIS